ncbi:MAG: hypothetical protein U9R26_05805 [Campylobacterota bacterium]|nr:hypothetical protein [Campylobacterota bacterium]
MKYLFFLLLPLLLYSNEQRILLSGFTIHEHSRDLFNEEYNSFNYGAGYEYNFFNEYKEVYFSGNILAINDSFANPQLIAGFGHYYRFDTGIIDTAFGLSGFVGLKKIYKEHEDLDRNDGHYGIMGGAGPVAMLYYKKFSVNFIYVPGITYKELETTGFLFTYFGFKF